MFEKTLGPKINVLSGFAFPSSGFTAEEGVPLIRIRDIANGKTEINYIGSYPDEYEVENGDLLIGMDGDFNVIRWEGSKALLNQRVCKIKSNSIELNQEFLFWYLIPHISDIHRTTPQTTVKHLSTKSLYQIPSPTFTYEEQKTIAKILDTLDTQIRQTEAIIAKLQQVKQGLLHDLLTRGIDASGQLRPPREQAPELYKESPLGWIPKKWSTPTINDVVESLSDGPFGSNLKTEHYVDFEGVRVIRLQNISAGKYDDADRAFISFKHANVLHKNKVISGDVLVASLGDQNHPVGRACLYPENFPDAINKADCFRLRTRSKCRNAFLTLALNSDFARKQVSGYEQGVTLKRINTSNLRKVILPLPLEEEQAAVECRYKSLDIELVCFEDELLKLKKQKAGLMDDLLTGRVRVIKLIDRLQAS